MKNLRLIISLIALFILALIMWLIHPKGIVDQINKEFKNNSFEAYFLYYLILILTILGMLHAKQLLTA